MGPEALSGWSRCTKASCAHRLRAPWWKSSSPVMSQWHLETSGSGSIYTTGTGEPGEPAAHSPRAGTPSPAHSAPRPTSPGARSASPSPSHHPGPSPAPSPARALPCARCVTVTGADRLPAYPFESLTSLAPMGRAGHVLCHCQMRKGAVYRLGDPRPQDLIASGFPPRPTDPPLSGVCPPWPLVRASLWGSPDTAPHPWLETRLRNHPRVGVITHVTDEEAEAFRRLKNLPTVTNL